MSVIFEVVYSQELPAVPKIKYIRLNTGDVEIAWEPSATPGVVSYAIWYKYLGFNAIPDWNKAIEGEISADSALYARFSPELGNGNALEKPVAFAIQATDTNGNQNLIDDHNTFWTETWKWDSSMFLSGEYDTCLSQVVLNWTPYDFNAWGDDALFVYRITVIENGTDTSAIALLDVSKTSYTHSNLNPNSVYKIYIAARSLGVNGESASNTININTHQTIVPEYIYADYATYSNGNVEVQFSVDPEGELTRYEILRATEPGGEYAIIAEVMPENGIVSYLDQIDFNSGPYYYRMQVANNCDIIARKSKNTASNIVLSSLGESIKPALEWNNYSNWINGVSHFDIERRIGNGDYEVINSRSNTNFSDNSLEQLVGRGYPASVCYRVIAHEYNNEFGNDALSQSNEVCLELPVNINFGFDAFTPGNSMGNSSFGPTIDFLPDEFDFKVLNRAGAVVFQTTDATNPRWDGRHNGQLVPQGAYMYVCEYRIGTGKRKVLRGGIAVVYP